MSTTPNNLEKDNQNASSNNNNEIAQDKTGINTNIPVTNEMTNNEKTVSDESNIKNFTDTVFTSTNLIILVGFLGAYGIVYYLSKKNNPEQPNMMTNDGSQTTSIAIDLFFLVIVGMILYTLYTSITSNPDNTISGEVLDNLSIYIDNPMSVLISIFSIIGFYTLTYMFGIPMERSNKPYSISFIESSLWVLLVIIVIVDFFKYIFGISLSDILDQIKTFFQEKKEDDKTDENEAKNITDDEITQEKCHESKEIEDPEAEVFNVSNNLYTYDDAVAVCKSYDAKLASYDQIEAAYNNGAEWCNYGWSEGQLALFPTQKATYDKLQKLDEGVTDPSEKKGNNCGRPGVNGGYIANPYVKFGVNCYGKKPQATEAELKMMENKKNQVYPKTPKEKALDKKIEYWKKNGNKYLTLNSYNTQKWSGKNNVIKTTEDKQDENKQEGFHFMGAVLPFLGMKS